ncbi:maleylpyruvate isomerase family mycothiol-dependent enzyme [Streptomyces sp. 3211]|uniref:maleylpyruvate isomerase family mycothiol-dependent enzyme n=1 Tax=Streptomyces sp. 3211 TaxID=1964449 RepID=UPI00181C7F18
MSRSVPRSTPTPDPAPVPTPAVVSRRTIASAVAAERRELADVLDSLTPEQWDAPSLCTGWRVREVAAHMSLGFRTTLPGFTAELLRARGSLHRMTDRTARRDAAALGTRELAALLRENACHPWKPPAAGPTGALAHDVVHGLDITVALGPRAASPRTGCSSSSMRSPPAPCASSAWT